MLKLIKIIGISNLLQRLMLKSSYNILVSIRQISSNSGRKSPGIDGFSIDGSLDKFNLYYEIIRNKYYGKDSVSIRRIYIKEPGKIRHIGIPTIYDRSSRPFDVLFRIDRDLAKSQNFNSPILVEYLFDNEEIQINNIVPRYEGGNFTFENLILLHYECYIIRLSIVVNIGF